ncbi:putative DNA repair protein RAD57 [Rosellinia necatrix]|uniref:Putative DNA repair protein RAD57 n=1 Tax=Rosellinia necatrix TaxID=77044 RepID=A0A1S7UKP2_ROSNE|nr:putative DNA repair protein RAD57 [Rosellinia necatrix]
MTDLSQVLPDFAVAQYARLLPAIEKNKLTVTDLLTLDLPDIGKRTQLPLLDLKRLCSAILAALHADLGVDRVDGDAGGRDGGRGQEPGQARAASRPERRYGGRERPLRQTGTELLARPWRTISTLDASLDAALGGGVPTGYITEITGESGAGKTQFLLTLLLSVQLPPPHGLGRPALYISTEAALSTKRLSQILAQNPFFRALDDDDDDNNNNTVRPSLDRVISTVTPDLESQDHILTYQVPVEVARRGIGLIVLDSVAANYRAEFDRGGGGTSGGGPNNMAARSAELARLGHLLRELAQKHDLAVVVANQVADRFSGSNPFAYSPALRQPRTPAVQSSGGFPGPRHGLSAAAAATTTGPIMSQESPLASRSRNVLAVRADAAEPPSSGAAATTADAPVRSSMPEPPPGDPDAPPPAPAVLSLDHQQRWFTGWGDDPYHHRRQHAEALKTPSLGLVWSTQIAARVALFRRPAYGRKVVVGDDSIATTAAADDYDDVADWGGGGGAAAGPYVKSWRRWMKVVFAPHVPGTGPGTEGAVEFDVVAGGLKAVERAGNKKGKERKGKAIND